MIMKSAKKSTPAMMPDVMPMMYNASHAGMEVLRYLNEQMSMNRDKQESTGIIAVICQVVE